MTQIKERTRMAVVKVFRGSLFEILVRETLVVDQTWPPFPSSSFLFGIFDQVTTPFASCSYEPISLLPFCYLLLTAYHTVIPKNKTRKPEDVPCVIRETAVHLIKCSKDQPNVL